LVKKIILILVIFSLIIFSGCEDKNKIEDEDEIKDSKIAQLESQIEQLNTKITELEGEIDELNKQIEYKDDFVEIMTEYISDGDLLTLARMEWTYNIQVDEEDINVDGLVELDMPTFSLKVEEVQNQYKALPTQIRNLGKISGSLFSNHIQFLDAKPSETSGIDEANISSATYVFKDLSPGTEVSLEISRELQDRLGLETNILKIIYLVDEEIQTLEEDGEMNDQESEE
jgi:outer membrane murein-binding lipoprotein Lpp